MKTLLSRIHSFIVLTAAVLATLQPVRSAEDSPASNEVKLLTIGNSFANDSIAFLPRMSEAGGKKLLIFGANLGGHSLEQHAGYLKAFEADPSDPKGRAYKGKSDPKTGEKRDFSLREHSSPRHGIM